MALLLHKSLQVKTHNVFPGGVSQVTDCTVEASLYVKIDNIRSTNKGEQMAAISFRDKALGVAYSDFVPFTYSFGGGDIFTQAYEQIKALPGFEGATDC